MGSKPSQKKKENPNKRTVHEFDQMLLKFEAFGASEQAVRTFSILKSKGRGAGLYLCEAYRVYQQRKSIPKSVREVVANLLQMRFVAQKYGIKDKKDIKKLLTNPPTVTEFPALEEGEYNYVYMRLPKTDIGTQLHEELTKEKGNKYRIFKVIDYIDVYTKSGYDIDVLQHDAVDLVKSLGALYESSQDDEVLDQVLHIINTASKAKASQTAEEDFYQLREQTFFHLNDACKTLD